MYHHKNQEDSGVKREEMLLIKRKNLDISFYMIKMKTYPICKYDINEDKIAHILYNVVHL